MPGFLHALLAIFLTVIQVSFLSHLPTPFSDISFPLIAITIAVFIDRPIRGAVWALLGGITLDLHGIYPYGTELSVLLIIFFLTRLFFRRFITNASLVASFFLSSVIIGMHTLLLLIIDGVRVLFGAEPFIITQDVDLGYAFLRMVIVNGLLTICALAGWKYLKARFAHRFIIRR